MCATLNSPFSHNFKLFRVIVVGLFAASLCIAAPQAHLVLSEHEQYWARPPPQPPIVTGRLEQRSPSEVMVDLSNNLAYKILHLHSILNRNNFAFSPAALMSVLVAVYEGSAGRSSLEIRNALLLPNNRDVVRVGYRDIHRRLRTYFFCDDNPLKGLSLNKENVTVTSEYETILKFYGYDMGSDMVSSTVAPTTIPAIDDSTTTTLPLTSTTMSTEATDSTTTPEPSTSTAMQSTTEDQQETTTTEAETTTPESTTTEMPPDEEATTTVSPESGEVDTLTGNSAEVSQKEKSNLKKLKPSGKLTSQPSLQYLPAKRKSNRFPSSKKTRRSIFGLQEFDPNFFHPFVQQGAPPFHQVPPPQAGFAIAAPPEDVRIQIQVEEIDAIAPLEGAYHKSAFHPDVERAFASSSQYGKNNEVIDHIFYLNNDEIIHTSFKIYNSVLYYRYFEHLRMSILEIELNSTDYNLMILLPDYDVDLLAAASSLAIGPTLRVLRKKLQPRWVHAIIPDFKLHGTMFLTSDLQNLGISDVFEPNRADFRAMTDERGIYVKHIQQDIKVSIRTRQLNQLKQGYGPQTRPIQLSVNHPFMFFIIDRDLDVATMAGRIMNPLNVRIQ